MTVLRARYAKIDALTSDLLEKYRVRGPAVPVENIARGEGASIMVREFNNEISGLLLRQGGSAIIGVEKKQSPARKRFTIAHELGHLMLHVGREVRFDTAFRINLRSPESSTAEDVEEIESNAFAAALLMPEPFLRNDTAGFVLDVEDAALVQKLAKRYNVSAQAMTVRLINLSSRGRL
ncbi:ImmA/IrrE family metallo-endopeptidase [Bradyrhizobium arachidis]|uniref:ImmA/IrrE family metallo-endopeptidase n=1 Tax=Bradyrhizobium arachidis TaxID=858423 RepID=UPI002162262C|nr:ImmA/IrrE family metallo-endopeptidase [Bradyrhizobium arachidis]UVO28160.1 ImmA/IrrE family metallo-endopeptidase [Bradyrhizobium arachidis]